MKENIFDRVEKKTKVKKEDILKLAKKISGQDLSDEDNLRTLIKDVAKLAGKEVSKENIDRLIGMRKSYGVTGRHPGFKRYRKEQ